MTVTVLETLAAVLEGGVQPNFWGGMFATLGIILLAVVMVMLLFNWDDPEKTRQHRDRDIMRGLWDDRRGTDGRHSR